MLGDTKANTLLAIKRVKLGRASNATLSFVAPAAPGPARLMLYFMCDSYMGADQEYEVRICLAVPNKAAAEPYLLASRRVITFSCLHSDPPGKTRSTASQAAVLLIHGGAMCAGWEVSKHCMHFQ